jgi:hypothetical protein
MSHGEDVVCPAAAALKHPFFWHSSSNTSLPSYLEDAMQEPDDYEVVQNGNGWMLRQGRTPLVEFPTEAQAVRAAIAVCRDEGLPRLLIRRAGGGVEVLDPWVLNTREA